MEFVSGPVVEYPLWVGGVQVTSANRYAIPGTDKGQASYDPDTKTLTLNDAIITGVHPYDGENRRASIFASGIDLKIVVEGENSVGKNDTYEGIRVQDPDNSSRNSLTITGEGKLDITAEMYAIIVNGHLTINETNSTCTVNATTGRNRAIYSTGRITVNGGTVKAVSNHLDAICCMEGMSIVSGSKVTAIAEGNYGIDANPGKIIIAENVDLTASGTKEALRTGKDNYVINLLSGTGWTNSEGSGSGDLIPVSVKGQKLDD